MGYLNYLDLINQISRFENVSLCILFGMMCIFTAYGDVLIMYNSYIHQHV